ncbi:hypothetical protein [Granulicella sp. dw_53]|uniref:hypothetical protein n=1 Tax=Granulicella sp. dw_53 TaxID=2719792 RepID=UPI001BD2193A|nr:hypothetical protein [Granulicella sp. dw_53]
MNAYRRTPTLPDSARLLVLAALALASVPTAQAADKKAPPAKPAPEYAAFDAHPNEHVTIAAEPCDDQKQCDFFRLPYVAHSLIPIRIIITNDSDQSLTLDDARFQFISANNDKIPAADLEEINRRMFTFKSAQGTKIPLTPIKIHHPPIDKKVTQDDADFGFKTTVVQPHSTLAGYLFYDIKALEDPALKDAQIYIKMIYTAPTANAADKHQLFAFTIPLDKWLSGRPKTIDTNR